MDALAASGAALGLGAAALAGAAFGSPGAWLETLGSRLLALESMKPAADRWERLAHGLGWPAGTVARRAGLSVLLLAAGILLLLMGPAGLLVAATSALPLLALEQAWARRAQGMEKDLPWILDFLTMGVQAGLDFEVALDRASRARPGPLASGIQSLISRIRMGLPRRQALAEWGERSRLPALGALAAALVQAEVMGSGLSPVLKAQAESLRLRRMQRAESQAQQAPVKMLFPLVLCIFPLTFLILFGPIFVSVSW